MTFNGDAQLESGERLFQTGDAPKRRWERLPIAIPIFVRGLDENGKSFVEFSTATNLNAGGILLLSRRNLPAGQEITLEIPTPTPQLIPAGQDSVKPMSATILYAQ